MDITSFLMGLQRGKAIGGGGSGGGEDHPDLRYVTFMNGSEVLYVKPVATGDDCVDVVAKGTITTPKKDSTVDKVFTYSGWSLTNGGSASSNALKAVTENRTVYAAYTESVRYYTITYYDSNGSTVLKTEQVAYGDTPSYKPTSDDYIFVSWVPDAIPVTGDANYTAKWKAKPTFATAPWSEIASVCEAGQAESTFAKGDERTEILTYADGTTEEITLVVVGYNEHSLYDGTSSPTLKSNLILMTKNALSKLAKAKSIADKKVWIDSDLKTYLNTDIYNGLSGELQGVIKSAAIDHMKGWTSGTACKLWTPSLEELGLKKENQSTTMQNFFNLYNPNLTFYFSDASRIKKQGNTGSDTKYYTRNCVQASSYAQYTLINETGKLHNSTSVSGTTEFGVVFGFCI